MPKKQIAFNANKRIGVSVQKENIQSPIICAATKYVAESQIPFLEQDILQKRLQALDKMGKSINAYLQTRDQSHSSTRSSKKLMKAYLSCSYEDIGTVLKRCTDKETRILNTPQIISKRTPNYVKMLDVIDKNQALQDYLIGSAKSPEPLPTYSEFVRQLAVYEPKNHADLVVLLNQAIHDPYAQDIIIKELENRKSRYRTEFQLLLKRLQENYFLHQKPHSKEQSFSQSNDISQSILSEWDQQFNSKKSETPAKSQSKNTEIKSIADEVEQLVLSNS